MGRSLTGTVVITGGNGSLGSEIAVAIAKAQPFTHLLLTARYPKRQDARDLISRIREIGPRSIEILSLDLTDLQSVTSFAHRTIDRVRRREIPPISTLIHSAAVASYTVDELTLDGYDPVYQTNCVAPFFLTVGLLEAFRAGDGTPDGDAKVIYIGCSAASEGRLDYFDHNQGRDKRPPGTILSRREGNVRFASSKLLASVALYALRRSLASVSSSSQVLIPIAGQPRPSTLQRVLTKRPPIKDWQHWTGHLHARSRDHDGGQPSANRGSLVRTHGKSDTVGAGADSADGVAQFDQQGQCSSQGDRQSCIPSGCGGAGREVLYPGW